MGANVVVPALDLSKVGGLVGPAHDGNGQAKNDGGGAAETAGSLAGEILTSGSAGSVNSEPLQVVKELDELFEAWSKEVLPGLLKVVVDDWFPKNDEPKSYLEVSGSTVSESDSDDEFEIVMPSSHCPIARAHHSIVDPILLRLAQLIVQVGGLSQFVSSSVVQVERAINALDVSMKKCVSATQIVGDMSTVVSFANALTEVLKKFLPQQRIAANVVNNNPLYSYCTSFGSASETELSPVVTPRNSSSNDASSQAFLTPPPTLEAIALSAPQVPASLHSQSKLSDSFKKVKTGVASLGVLRAFSVLCQQVGMRWHQMAVGERLRSLCKAALGLSPGLLFAGSLGAWHAVVVPRV